MSWKWLGYFDLAVEAEAPTAAGCRGASKRSSSSDLLIPDMSSSSFPSCSVSKNCSVADCGALDQYVELSTKTGGARYNKVPVRSFQ